MKILLFSLDDQIIYFLNLKIFFNFKFKIDNIKNKELTQNFYNKFFFNLVYR